jgi:hypothetical protein
MVISHFPIDKGVFNAIQVLVQKGSTIVELGSGTGTNLLASEYKVYSVEDNEEWVGYCGDSNYIYAPLVELKSDKLLCWYDPEVLKKSLPEEYDLLLIDGPFGERGRDGLIENLELFRTDIPIVIDDTIRDHECRIAREIAFLMNRPLYVFWNFSVIASAPLPEETIAKIQLGALRILETEHNQYLRRHFKKRTTFLPIDTSVWRQFELESRSDRKRIEMIESSFTWRIGRIITRPLWPIHKLKSMITKRMRK